tara:strand:- start:14340 stop:14444 length:105 start_codon:yes stop_codon:yes gene_type:complete
MTITANRLTFYAVTVALVGYSAALFVQVAANLAA